MKHHVKRLMPTQESMRRNRWLRWIGPALHHPRLWHMSRRGVALGMAIGVFFGLLIPIAQIPLSVGAAVLLRANVPTAAVSTLVSNPATYGPLYYAAWRLGKAVLGHEVGDDDAPPVTAPQAPPDNGRGWIRKAWDSVAALGKPLLLGMALMATTVGLATYVIANWVLVLKTRWERRRRLRERDAARRDAGR
ncbi:MAG: DUF2062 domain-containing protein [Rubrivivax sp.]|nr:DUF2062 domain-containing protein [Rubrivivax sp.]